METLNHLEDWPIRIMSFLNGGGSARSFLLVTENSNDKRVLNEVLHKFLPNVVDYQSNVLWIGEDGEKINIDRIRTIYSFFNKTSYNALPRVTVIENIDQLNLHSGNALLKILEDCGVDAYFILTCANVNLVMPTIRSRCVRMLLPRNGAVKNVDDDNFSLDFSNMILSYRHDPRVAYEFLDKYFSKEVEDHRWSNFVSCIHAFADGIIKDEGNQLDQNTASDISLIYSFIDKAEKCNLSLYNVALLILQKLKGKNDR